MFTIGSHVKAHLHSSNKYNVQSCSLKSQPKLRLNSTCSPAEYCLLYSNIESQDSLLYTWLFQNCGTQVPARDYYRCNNYVSRKVWFCVSAWTWNHRHSHLNCLTTRGSTWDLGNCLLFMLLICVGIEWETWCCGSTIIENSKQKTTKHR